MRNGNPIPHYSRCCPGLYPGTSLLWSIKPTVIYFINTPLIPTATQITLNSVLSDIPIPPPSTDSIINHHLNHTHWIRSPLTHFFFLAPTVRQKFMFIAPHLSLFSSISLKYPSISFSLFKLNLHINTPSHTHLDLPFFLLRSRLPSTHLTTSSIIHCSLKTETSPVHILNTCSALPLFVLILHILCCF